MKRMTNHLQIAWLTNHAMFTPIRMNFINKFPIKCVECFSIYPSHLDKGCPHCTNRGIIVKYDASAVVTIYLDFLTWCGNHPGCNGGGHSGGHNAQGCVGGHNGHSHGCGCAGHNSFNHITDQTSKDAWTPDNVPASHVLAWNTPHQFFSMD